MDDEEFILQVTMDILQGLGYETEVAHDGEEALRAYGQAMKDGRKFDVVIMDLTVPGGMGGKETIGHLLKMDPQARAIVSSGYSNDPVMADYQNFIHMICLPKPHPPVLKIARGLGSRGRYPSRRLPALPAGFEKLAGSEPGAPGAVSGYAPATLPPRAPSSRPPDLSLSRRSS